MSSIKSSFAKTSFISIFRYICTVKRAKLIIICIWIFSFIYNSPWLYLATLKEEDSGLTCSFKLERHNWSYKVIYFGDLGMFYVIPMILNILIYGRITYTLSKSSIKGNSPSLKRIPSKRIVWMFMLQERFRRAGRHPPYCGRSLNHRPQRIFRERRKEVFHERQDAGYQDASHCRHYLCCLLVTVSSKLFKYNLFRRQFHVFSGNGDLEFICFN